MTTPPTNADLVLRHGRVITMDAQRRILADGTVAVRDGAIVWAGPDRDWPARTPATTTRDLAGAVVHPGLVDAHVHTGTETVRGLAPKGDGDWGDVEAAAYLDKSEEDEETAALLSAMDMLSSGTTLFADTGGSVHLDATARGIEAAGLRGVPGHFLVDVDADPVLRDVLGTTEHCLGRLADQLRRWPGEPGHRVRAAVTLVGMGLASDALLEGAADLARREDRQLLMHQSWGIDEVEECLRRNGVRPVQHLANLRVLGPHCTLVHAIQLDDSELALVAETGTHLVHCPSASLRRAKGAVRHGRFPEYLAAGVNVALGSDGMSGPRDLFRQAYLAAMLFREMRGQLPTITAEQALEMATLHGARALGLESEVGSIEAGKRADLVVHSTTSPQSLPAFRDPVDWLVFYAGARTVETVYVDGELVFDHGDFPRLDAPATRARIQRQAEAHELTIGATRYSTWPVVG